MCAARNVLSTETSRERYGVLHPRQLKEVRDKAKQTCLQKYGVDNPLKSAEIKAKVKETCRDKYGVENAFQSKEIQEKKKQNYVTKYGVEHQMHREEVKEKVKRTNLERYGVEQAARSQEIKDKTKAYFTEKYGVDNPFKSEEIKAKIKAYNLQTWGVEYSFQSAKFQANLKQAVLIKYGVDNVRKSEEVKSKIKATLKERYGVEHALQHPEFFEKFQKSSKAYKEVEIEGRKFRLQGYEEPALRWMLDELKIPIADIKCSLDDKKNLKINYNHSGKVHAYYPDFLIGSDVVVEVKSTFTLYHNREALSRLRSKAGEVYRQGKLFWLLLVIATKGTHKVFLLPDNWSGLTYEDLVAVTQGLLALDSNGTRDNSK